jgi:hypothetical protein
MRKALRADERELVARRQRGVFGAHEQIRDGVEPLAR